MVARIPRVQSALNFFCECHFYLLQLFANICTLPRFHTMYYSLFKIFKFKNRKPNRMVHPQRSILLLVTYPVRIWARSTSILFFAVLNSAIVPPIRHESFLPNYSLFTNHRRIWRCIIQIISRHVKKEGIPVFSKTLKSALGPTQPHIQCFSGVKRPESEVGHSSPGSSKFKNLWSHTSTLPICLHSL
jgi:hypothetical protein